jgi:hypothetical protein
MRQSLRPSTLFLTLVATACGSHAQVQGKIQLPPPAKLEVKAITPTQSNSLSMTLPGEAIRMEFAVSGAPCKVAMTFAPPTGAPWTETETFAPGLHAIERAVSTLPGTSKLTVGAATGCAGTPKQVTVVTVVPPSAAGPARPTIPLHKPLVVQERRIAYFYLKTQGGTPTDEVWLKPGDVVKASWTTEGDYACAVDIHVGVEKVISIPDPMTRQANMSVPPRAYEDKVAVKLVGRDGCITGSWHMKLLQIKP